MSGRKRSQQDVELNMASMLDMAFQLLAFFILTFQPPPLESQISLRLPPATGRRRERPGQPGNRTPRSNRATSTRSPSRVIASRTANIDFAGRGPGRRPR